MYAGLPVDNASACRCFPTPRARGIRCFVNPHPPPPFSHRGNDCDSVFPADNARWTAKRFQTRPLSLMEVHMLDRHVLAACCVAALPFAAHAQMSYPAGQYFDDRWYVTPFGAYVFPDNNRQAENGWGGGLAVGKP